VYPVSNMGSHSTQYATVVPFTNVCCPEDGLQKDRKMLPQSDINIIYCCCVLDRI